MTTFLGIAATVAFGFVEALVTGALDNIKDYWWTRRERRRPVARAPRALRSDRLDLAVLHFLRRVVCPVAKHDWRPRMSGGYRCERCMIWTDRQY